jgi:hypothetical protein
MWTPIEILFCVWHCNFAPIPEGRLNVADALISQERKIAEKEFNLPYITFYFHKKDADLIATFNKPLALKKYKEALIELIVFKNTSPEYNNYQPMINYNEKYLIQKITQLEGI